MGRKRAFPVEIGLPKLRAALRKPAAAELPRSSPNRYKQIARATGTKVEKCSWTKLRHYFGKYAKGETQQQVTAAILATLVVAVEARRLLAGSLADAPFQTRFLDVGGGAITQALEAKAQGGNTLGSTIDAMHCHNVRIVHDRPFEPLQRLTRAEAGIGDVDKLRSVAMTVALNGSGVLDLLQRTGGRAPGSAGELETFLREAYAQRVQPYSVRHLPQRALRDPIMALLGKPLSKARERTYVRTCMQGLNAWIPAGFLMASQTLWDDLLQADTHGERYAHVERALPGYGTLLGKNLVNWLHALRLLPSRPDEDFLAGHPDGPGADAFLQMHGGGRDCLLRQVNELLQGIKTVTCKGQPVRGWTTPVLDSESCQFMACAASRLVEAFTSGRVPQHLRRNAVVAAEEAEILARCASWTPGVEAAASGSA
ncbi:unnamed protein product [Prorocentrum cordatum]|uniref:Uncharacterized protein n=1 Tax=Prorocentrum cordatum TaxID=2364126 RepID=A0ABN9UY03_9DINO|nr:unnamed protein product [Polarella glacialis]